MESAQNRGYFAPQGWLPTPELRVASDRPTGGAYGWLKSAVGRATGSELRTRKSLIRLDFIEHKSERSVMPQNTGLAGTSFWTVWTSPAYSGSGSRPSGLLPHARSLAFSCAVFWRTNASAGLMAGFRPQPGALWPPWRTGRQATRRRSRRVRFCRHPSRPRVEWPDLPGRGNRQRLSVRWQTYPSLTTIAKRITGTHWSGPRFFGLTPKRKA